MTLPQIQTVDDNAIVTINGHEHILGKSSSDVATAEYERLMAEYRASGFSKTFGVPIGTLTVVQLIDVYLEFASSYYGPGSSRNETKNMEYATKLVRKLYGHCLASSFGPLQLKTVRQAMVDEGGARSYVNDRVKRIVRMFRWAVSEGLLPPAVPQALSMVSPLRRGRTTAKECRKIKPVESAIVDATLPHLSTVVRAMVELQRITGARPGEICIMRPCDIDRSAAVWEYRPAAHKNMNRDKDRVIYIGPRGQKILLPYLLRAAESFCFSPKDASDENNMRFVEDHVHGRRPRKTPLYPCEVKRVEAEKRRPKKLKVGPRFLTGSYANAIRRACWRAFGKDGAHWFPNQLRHLAATEFRKQFGLEAAQILLGHAAADVTQIYAERDAGVAIKIAQQVG